MRRALLLVATGGALAASIGAALGCSSCDRPPELAILGGALYSALLIATLVCEEWAAVRWTFMAAAGFHLGLICAMAARDALCPLCLVTAACAFLSTVLTLAPDRHSWPLFPVIAPWTAAFGLMAAPVAPPTDAPDHLRIVAYTRADCPYCDELRDRVLPEATRGFEIEVIYRDAEAADFVQRAPTLLVSRGARHRVLEGLPTVEKLREAIAAVAGEAR